MELCSKLLLLNAVEGPAMLANTQQLVRHVDSPVTDQTRQNLQDLNMVCGYIIVEKFYSRATE